MTDEAPRKLRVFVSGPYSTGDPGLNVAAALDAADRLWEAGHVPFVPHLAHYWDGRTPRSWDDWMQWCLQWVAQCDAVLRIPGESRGADLECAKARQLGIPVWEECECPIPACNGYAEATVKMVDGFPRRGRLDLAIPAEAAVRAAMAAVEEAGADPLLADAVVLLGQALDKVADYVDGQIAEKG